MSDELKEFNGTAGYPKGGPPYERIEKNSRTLKPDDHFFKVNRPEEYQPNKTDYLVDNTADHFIRDLNDPTDGLAKTRPTTYTDTNGDLQVVFSGSTTNVNPYHDTNKDKIITQGLENSELDNATKKNGSDAVPKISPILPFTRLDPFYAQQSNLITYNRTKTPVADLEFRKGFRHLFITRPECYVMAANNGSIVLSQQAEYDEDFSSAYSRAPHLLSLLSPSYITGSFSNCDLQHNWNYLLSNRVDGLSAGQQFSMSYDENMTKSSEGYTISPAKHMTSRQGSTISLTFTDTKNLEISTFLNLWIAYMHKRKRGTFAPPYNGYQYINSFMKVNGSSTKVTGINNHPYDRALEYCASLFDIVTNESGSKIVYWCKYYGLYPTEVTLNGLSNTKNAPLEASPTVEATFKYQRKIEYSNKTLIEFNYNAGIIDEVGKIKSVSLEASYPFLLNEDPDNQYIGASSMFTGSPYILLAKSGKDPWKGSGDVMSPYLQFAKVKDGALNWNINNGIVNNRSDDMNDTVMIK